MVSGGEVSKIDSSTTDTHWQLVQRVAQSRTFARSARLPQFLLYVCERALAGRTDEINEQRIGVHVFGRPADYNSAEDNIVRAQARLLRKKLDEYFEDEGREEPIRIQIPKGGYLPAFEACAPPPVEPRGGNGKRWAMVAAAVVVLAAITYPVIRWSSTAQHRESRRFWAMLFNPDRPTFIVPSDTALVVYQRLTGREVSLGEYINRQFDPSPGLQASNDPRLPESVVRARYTNMPDIELCWRLARSPGFNLSNTTLRYARELRINDLKSSNAVLLGARRANPWVELFHSRLNYQALFDAAQGRDQIVNRNPAPSEEKVYMDHDRDGQRWSYSVIAFVGGLNDQGHALLIGGTTTAGTEGAIDFLLNEERFGALLKRLGATDRIPHFEALLHTGNVAGNARQTELIGYRVHKQ